MKLKELLESMARSHQVRDRNVAFVVNLFIAAVQIGLIGFGAIVLWLCLLLWPLHTVLISVIVILRFMIAHANKG